jgi:hypothetical protein
VRDRVVRSAVKATGLAELLNKACGVAFGDGDADIGLGWEIVVDACGLYADGVGDVAGALSHLASKGSLAVLDWLAN